MAAITDPWARLEVCRTFDSTNLRASAPTSSPTRSIHATARPRTGTEATSSRMSPPAAPSFTRPAAETVSLAI